MKGKVYKCISCILALLLILEFVLPIMGITSSLITSEAAGGSGTTNLVDLQNLRIRGGNLEKLDIFAKNEQLAGGMVTLGNTGKMYVIDGATVNFKMHDNSPCRVERYIMDKTTGNRYNGSGGGTQIFSGNSFIEFNASQLEGLYLYYTGGDVNNLVYAIDIYKGASDQKVNATPIQVEVGTLHIEIDKMNGNTQLLEVDGVFKNLQRYPGNIRDSQAYRNRTLLIKKGGSVKLKNDRRQNATITILEGPFVASGNTISSTGNGTGRAIYSCCGVNTEIKLQTSNLSLGNLFLTMGTCYECQALEHGYNTTKTVKAYENRDTNYRIIQQKLSYDLSVDRPSITVDDLTGCLNSKVVNTMGCNERETRLILNARRDGVIRVKSTDYLGRTVEEYWRIIVCHVANLEVENRQPDNFEIRTPSNEDDSNAQSPAVNPQGEMGTYEIPTAPPVQGSVVWDFDGDNMIVDVFSNNCSENSYIVLRRENENVGHQINGVYYNGATALPGGNLQGHRVTINRRQMQNGCYDVIFQFKNDDDVQLICITLYMGPNYTAQKPVITIYDKGTNTLAGRNVLNVVQTGCQRIKYLVYNRRKNGNIPYNVNSITSYDAFQGNEVTPSSEFTITIDSSKTGYGVYDVVVVGENGDGNVTYTTWSYINVEVKAQPRINIETESASIKTRTPKYNISAYTIDDDYIQEAYYYVRRKDNPTSGDFVLPNLNEIKKPSGDNFGGTIKGKTSVTIDKDKLKAGYYDLIVYAKNSSGLECSQYVKDIPVYGKLSIDYSLEENGKKTSVASKYTQTVNVKVSGGLDKDITLYAYTSPYDQTQNGKKKLDFYEIPNNTKIESTKMIEIKGLKSGETVPITITAKDGEDRDVYMYFYAVSDDYVSAQMLRTAGIRLNGKKLELERMYINQDAITSADFSEVTKYGNGNTVEVVLQFNNEIDKSVGANLFVKIGEKVKSQDNVVVDKNRIIFTYNITDDCGEGSIEIDHIEYENAILVDGGSYNNSNNIYSRNIKEEQIEDEITGKFLVDARRPEVSEICIDLAVDSSKLKENAEGNVIYISEFNEAKAEVTYDEEVYGMPASIRFVKGNKAPFYVDTIGESARTVDVYDLKEWLDDADIKKAEGSLKLEWFVEDKVSLADGTGNKVKFPKEPVVKYKINGTEITGKDVVFDSSVYDPELYINNEKIKGDGTYVKGTSIKAFAEYSNSKRVANYYDESGITKLELNIDYNSATIVKDQDGNVIEPTSNGNSRKDSYASVASYVLTKEQLPLTIDIPENGKYYLTAIKEDYVGNKAEKNSEIQIEDKIFISEEKSGLFGITDNEMHKLKDLTDDQKKYTLTIGLQELNSNDIKVYLVDQNSEKELNLVSTIEDGIEYANYNFNIYRAGKYVIKVKDTSGKVLLTDFVNVGNVYILGDADLDGKRTSVDVIAILRYIALFDGYWGVPSIKYAGDVNGDGETDVGDAVLLCRFFAEDQDAYINFDR